MTTGEAGSEERLWRHEDPGVFEATVLIAAEQLDVQPLAVTKDYWVCQALRAIVREFPGQVVFKGGTSLEKLRIIQRFSEDLDLLVVAEIPNRNQGKRKLTAMCRAAAAALECEPEVTKSGGELGTLHRHAYLTPPLAETGQSALGLAEPDRVLVELGQSGGPHPFTVVRVTSLLTRQLQAANFEVAAYDDLQSFAVPILNPGRTLLEKLLRVNNFSVKEAARVGEHGWPRIGRQFYDIWALLGDGQTLAFLADQETAGEVLADCYEISKMFTEDEPQPDGGFSSCVAFDPTGPLASQLREQHNTAMENLYYGPGSGPSFNDVLDRVHAHAQLLNIPNVPASPTPFSELISVPPPSGARSGATRIAKNECLAFAI